jgi:hypothetical protein
MLALYVLVSSGVTYCTMVQLHSCNTARAQLAHHELRLLLGLLVALSAAPAAGLAAVAAAPCAGLVGVLWP